MTSLLFGRRAFCECSYTVFESESVKGELLLDLPEVSSIQLGYDAFKFKDDESSTLIMKSESNEMK